MRRYRTILDSDLSGSKRIGVLTSGSDFGGAEKYGVAWLESLLESGHKPALLHPAKVNYTPSMYLNEIPAFEYDLKPGVSNFHRFNGLRQFRNLPGFIAHLASSVKSLGEVLQRFQPDILVSFGLKSHMLMNLSRAAKCSLKVVILNDVIGVGWLALLYRMMFRLTPSTRIIAPSRFALTKNGISLERQGTFVIPPPVDIHVAQGDKTDRNRGISDKLGSELNITDNPFILTCVGFLSPYKRQDTFIRLIHRLRERFESPVHGLVVGTAYQYDLTFEKRLHDLVEELNVSDAVSFLGWREDIPDILAASDLFVHLSSFEVFGMAVVEAMASGCPVLSWDLDGLTDTLTNGTEGILVPEGELDTLTETAVELLENENMRIRMGNAGKKKVATCFSMEQFRNRVAALMDRTGS